MLTVKNLYSSTMEAKGKGIAGFQIADASFTLEDGMITALIGKNGAGKSTLLEALYGILKKSKGEIEFNGYPVNQKNMARFHREAALVSENIAWNVSFMTLRENAAFLGKMYDSYDEGAFYEYLERFDFSEKDYDKRMEQLSSGQKMQVQIAFAAARSPKLMLLDEPFANLDPVVKTDIMEILQNLVAKKNTSILVSTHLLDEIDEVTDYIAVLDHGKLVRFGSRIEVMEGENREGLKGLLLGGNVE